MVRKFNVNNRLGHFFVEFFKTEEAFAFEQATFEVEKWNFGRRELVLAFDGRFAS